MAKKAIVIGIIVAIIVIAAGIGAYLATAGKAPPKQPVGPALTTIVIGSPLPLSGDQAPEGEFCKCWIKVAAKDINKWLEEQGLPYRVQVIFEDDKCSPTGSRMAIEALAARGAKIYVGSMCSAAFEAAIPFAQEHKYIAISIASTSAKLRTRDAGGELSSRKYTFRMPITDIVQAQAIVEIAKNLGLKALCVIYRKDIWGVGLAEGIEFLGRREGLEVKTIPYPITAKEYSALITELKRCVDTYASKYGKDKVAPVAISFGELAAILKQVSKTAPDLLNYLWLGSDGVAERPDLVKKEICPLTTKIKLPSTVFMPEITPERQKLIDEVEKKVQEECPGASGSTTYAILGYDAMWVAVLSYIKTVEDVGKFDPDYMYEILPKVAYNFSKGLPIVTKKHKLVPPVKALSGVIEFDESNDRKAKPGVTKYTIWMIVPSDGGCKWVEAGVWTYGVGVTWKVSIK